MTLTDWLIRSQHNRFLPDDGKLWTTILAGATLGGIEFEMPARQGQAARQVQQQVFASKINLPDGKGGLLSVTCLIAQEINAPANCKPVEWRLLTNRRVVLNGMRLALLA
jgi:hypothetical protein